MQTLDYDALCARFRWEDCAREMVGLPQGGLNIAYEAVDRHALGPRGDAVALRWLSRRGEVQQFTYRQLKEGSDRFAAGLAAAGVEPGQRVFTLLGRVPELYLAALGTLKRGAVFCPLFSAFGPEPIEARLSRGDARLLVTNERLYRKRVAGLRGGLPQLDRVLLTDGDLPMAGNFHDFLRAAPAEFPPYSTQPEDMALLHFTSGTTGPPKGAIHVHQAVWVHWMTGKYVLDLHPGDVYWCTADPGWVTGTSYGIIAPFLHGVTNLVDEADFEAERWYSILQEQRVNVWYTAPTAVRMLMRLPGRPRDRYDLSALRLALSVGEPLNPEAVLWSRDALGVTLHDNWWQTETGGIMIANYSGQPVKPGSMGRPLPGVRAAILRRTASGVESCSDGEEGELALATGWPSMFRGYLHEEERYRKCFHDGWYFSGDLARRDSDGYFWFLGRKDDIIKSAGHMVSPFEVESALMEHPAVAEAAVIGKPEPTIGELVKAFVSLRSGHPPGDELRAELLGFGRSRLGSAVAPKELDFLDTLPRTRSGKIMRRLLKCRELGLPEGDLSTLEVPE